MAGNIVKWWRRHLSGYKQFSVVQESTTDSEELIFPMRPPSSCLSAPPDLLSTSIDADKLIPNPSESVTPQKPCGADVVDHHHHRAKMNELKCDVSVEDHQKPQPLQFSFTLYDLDGHGKITKDDIAGIVSTIYESIGKSVVVPHYGSKTINVRLTVSPDTKIKSPVNKLPSTSVKRSLVTPRRRYRQKKIISDDEDGSDTSENYSKYMNERSNSNRVQMSGNRLITDQPNNSVNNQNVHNNNNNSTSNNNNLSKNRVNFDTNTLKSCLSDNDEFNIDNANNNNNTSNQKIINNNSNNNNSNHINNNCNNNNTKLVLYESLENLKCNKDVTKMTETNLCCLVNEEACAINKEHNNYDNVHCKVDACTYNPNMIAGRKTSSKKKNNRKSRSRKQRISPDAPRIRSLSVGNEKNYHDCSGNAVQDIPWKNSRRHELIEIIRASMEKNRLCFQPKRKQGDIMSRHRSHTISKMIGDHHLNEFCDSNKNNEAQFPNLCGYDSFLHATICSNENNVLNSTMLSPKHQASSKPNRTEVITAKNKTRKKLYDRSQKSTPVKLSTALLNHLNPNLSSEQKLSRTINQVEKWLERDAQINTMKLKNSEINFKLDKSNISTTPERKSELFTPSTSAKIDNLLLDQLKITENLSEVNLKPLKKHNLHVNKLLQTHDIFPSVTNTNLNNSNNNINNINNNHNKNSIFEYSSVPIKAHPLECENLLQLSDDEIPNNNGSNASSAQSQSTVHRYVHIHHHYHHFENET